MTIACKTLLLVQNSVSAAVVTTNAANETE